MSLNLSEQIKKYKNETICCPMDGGKIPIIFKEKHGETKKIMFSWCHFCGLVFSYIAIDRNNYQLIFSLYWNDELCDIAVWKQHLNNLPILDKLAFSRNLEISTQDILQLKQFAKEIFGFLNTN